MSDHIPVSEREKVYQDAATWAQERDLAGRKSRRLAWIIAGVATTVALCEAAAIVALAPLKTVVPYTLLVDRQTGHVEALRPLERDLVTPDKALTRSFLAQYVIAREGFAIDTLQTDFRKVALWSAGEARDHYVADMQATNPASPLATLPRRALVTVQIRSISSLKPDTALVRFSTQRSDPGAQMQPAETWAAVVTWRFSGEAMTADDRLLNPLGFQVTRYRKDAEVIPEPNASEATYPSGVSSTGQAMSAPKQVAPTSPTSTVREKPQ